MTYETPGSLNINLSLKPKKQFPFLTGSLKITFAEDNLLKICKSEPAREA